MNLQDDIAEVFTDKKLSIFFKEWLASGLNGKKAYLKLHPNIDDHSAETLGSRMLRKVEVSMILEAYGLGMIHILNN